MNYFAEERKSINVNLREDGLYAVSMVGFTSVGEGPMSKPCYFNVSCYTETEKYSSTSLSSGISQYISFIIVAALAIAVLTLRTLKCSCGVEFQLREICIRRVWG